MSWPGPGSRTLRRQAVRLFGGGRRAAAAAAIRPCRFARSATPVPATSARLNAEQSLFLIWVVSSLASEWPGATSCIAEANAGARRQFRFRGKFLPQAEPTFTSLHRHVILRAMGRLAGDGPTTSVDTASPEFRANQAAMRALVAELEAAPRRGGAGGSEQPRARHARARQTAAARPRDDACSIPARRSSNSRRSPPTACTTTPSTAPASSPASAASRAANASSSATTRPSRAAPTIR